jgi:hypothetical protein
VGEVEVPWLVTKDLGFLEFPECKAEMLGYERLQTLKAIGDTVCRIKEVTGDV